MHMERKKNKLNFIVQVFRRKEKQIWGEESFRLYGTKTGKDMDPDPITHRQRLTTPGGED